uniref:NEDD4-binding protein 1 n=1 Tax=Tetraodon nigroviridis TaxID=99883 RepID=H3C9E1_TETNG
RTMGYQQEVVERVVKETGQTEDTFLILEKIVEETKRCEERSKGAGKDKRSKTNPASPEDPSSSLVSPASRVGEEREPGRVLADAGKSKENIQPERRGGKGGAPGHRRQCSSSEARTQQAVTIRRSSSAQGGAGPYEVITIEDDDVPSTDNCQSVSRMDCLARGGSSASQRDFLLRGGTQTLGGSVKVESVMALRSTPQAAPPLPRPSPYQTVGHQQLRGKAPPSSEPPPPVTGLARFHQALRTPYTLKLPNEPGSPDLRHVIIDGSNVAMAHGLHRFFSCRGIALAVETFWRRGHRNITVFVPQWRQKRDRLTTEQHFLNQLEDLRLLSFTPSREVCGQRIASHDDRFLLHLAEKTGGVIVTNDNLRDFVDTSDTWRRIIQERLLQFTFVEDHFMIPDDPLGRNGPHLNDFLRKHSWTVPAAPPPLRPPDLHLSSRQQPACFHSPPQTPTSTSWPPTSPGPQYEWSPPCRRSAAETAELKGKLYDIFPDQKQRIDRILGDNPYMRDLNALSGLLLG